MKHKLLILLLFGSALGSTAFAGDNDTDGSSCNVTGKTITGVDNSSCRFKDTNSYAIISCVDASIKVNGNIGSDIFSNTTFTTKITTINGFLVKCP